MRVLFKGANGFSEGVVKRLDVAMENGRIVEISPRIFDHGFDISFDFTNYFITPGFVDVHVHLREPGFSMKERIKTGTQAAARGGYVAVCAMPNVRPAPDSPEHLRPMQKRIAADALIRVIPYGAITVGQAGKGALADLEGLAPYVAGFSDDGRGIQCEALMREAMTRSKALGKRIFAHCEVDELVGGGCVHLGRYARAHGLPGIPSESEWQQVARDLRLVQETGCAYHVCHVSTAESVALIRAAKREGLPVTCETAPHYLTLTEDDLEDDGRFKMNPPLRAASDRAALIEGARDGTIDVIATDHAPHTGAEKARGLRGSLMGVVGLETAFPSLYTRLVKPGTLSMTRLLEMLCLAPRKLLGLSDELRPGLPATFNALDLAAENVVQPEDFLSLGRATPFAGLRLAGENALTVWNGKIVWARPDLATRLQGVDERTSGDER